MQEMGKVTLTEAMKQKQAQSINQLKRLGTRHNRHWFLEGTGTECRVYCA